MKSREIDQIVEMDIRIRNINLYDYIIKEETLTILNDPPVIGSGFREGDLGIISKQF